jgi:hypothetical protein
MLLRFHLCRLLLRFFPIRCVRVLIGWRGITHPAKVLEYLLARAVPIAFQRRKDLRPPHLP